MYRLFVLPPKMSTWLTHFTGSWDECWKVAPSVPKDHSVMVIPL